MLHNLDTKPGFVPVWGQNNSPAAILGYAYFVKMVDAEKGEKFKEKVRSLIAQGKLAKSVKEGDEGKEGEEGGDKPWWNVT